MRNAVRDRRFLDHHSRWRWLVGHKRLLSRIPRAPIGAHHDTHKENQTHTQKSIMEIHCTQANVYRTSRRSSESHNPLESRRHHHYNVKPKMDITSPMIFVNISSDGISEMHHFFVASAKRPNDFFTKSSSLLRRKRSFHSSSGT